MRDTVLLDLNEVKADFWDRLCEIAREDDKPTRLLLELATQIETLRVIKKSGGNLNAK